MYVVTFFFKIAQHFYSGKCSGEVYFCWWRVWGWLDGCVWSECMIVEVGGKAKANFFENKYLLAGNSVHFTSLPRNWATTSWIPTWAVSLVSTYVVCRDCDAVASFGCENFVLKIPWVLPLKYLRNRVSRVPSPPHPRNENCQRCWDFRFDLIQSIPPPPPASRKWKLDQVEGVCIWVGLE